MWTQLPDDLVDVILSMRRDLVRRIRGCVRIQRTWRMYRVLTLYQRFRMLQYLREFRAFNPTIHVFMRRARL